MLILDAMLATDLTILQEGIAEAETDPNFLRNIILV